MLFPPRHLELQSPTASSLRTLSVHPGPVALQARQSQVSLPQTRLSLIIPMCLYPFAPGGPACRCGRTYCLKTSPGEDYILFSDNSNCYKVFLPIRQTLPSSYCPHVLLCALQKDCLAHRQSTGTEPKGGFYPGQCPGPLLLFLPLPCPDHLRFGSSFYMYFALRALSVTNHWTVLPAFPWRCLWDPTSSIVQQPPGSWLCCLLSPERGAQGVDGLPHPRSVPSAWEGPQDCRP